MKKIFRSPWAWCAVACAALFAGSGLLMRGNALNEALPGGFLGWVFWGALALLAWRFLIAPLAGFVGLPQWKSDAEQEKLSDLERLHFLEDYADRMLKNLADARRGNAELDEKLVAVESALREMDAQWRLRELRESVVALRKFLEEKFCGKIIAAHMKCGAVAVVVSQKGLLDSLVVFAVQIRLIVALSRALGHRPSWAFVSCCMAWVVANSLLSMIFDETNITETAFDSLGEMLGAQSGGLLGEIPFMKTLANLVMQAATAAASVYVTGALVRSRLLGSAEKKTLKELLRIRLSGYKEAAKIAGEIGQTFVFGKNASAGTPSAGGIESEMEEARA